MPRTSITLPNALTLTRASVKTLFGAGGSLVTTAVDNPAFNYELGAVKGLRIERAASNLAGSTAAPDTVFTVATGGTTTANQKVAPDGTTTMAKFVMNASNSSHFAGRNAWTISNSGTLLALSVFVENSGAGKVRLRLTDHSATTNSIYADFDLAAGTALGTGVGGAGSVVAARIQPYANGYRLWVIGTPNPGNANNLQARLLCLNSAGSSETFTGDGVSGFYFWGINLAAQALADSFIPTTTAPGTRAVDIARLASVAPYLNPAEGTITFQARILNTAPSGIKQQLFRFDDGTDDNVIEAFNAAGTANIEARIRAGGATVFNQVGGTFAAGGTVKGAITFAAGAFGIALDGAAAVTGSSGAVPTGLGAPWLGCSGAAGADSLTGEVQKFLLYQHKVSAGALPGLTV